MSMTHTLLDGIARRATARPLRALILALVACVALGLPALGLRLDPDPVSMLPRDAGPLRLLNELVTVFGSGDQLFLALETRDGQPPDEAQLQRLRSAIEELAETVSAWRWHNPTTDAEEGMMGLVVGKRDRSLEAATRNLVGAAGFLALPDDPAILERLTARLNPRRLAAQFRRGPPAGVPAPLHHRDLLGLWTDFYLPHLDLLDDADLPLRNDDGYLCTADRSCHVLLLNPLLPIKNMPFTQAIARRLQDLEVDFAADSRWEDLRLRVAGGYLLANEDYTAVRESAVVTLLTSMVAITILFGVVYRSLRLIGFIAAAILPAIAAALGMATIAFGGTLSLMVSAFSAVLVGLGVDYVIHVYNAYGWSLDHQNAAVTDARERRADAARRAVHRVGPGILLGCITSVASFGILGLSDFRGLRELGMVTAFGLSCILLMMLVVTPALLTLWGPNRCHQSRLLNHYTNAFARRPRRFVSITVALAVFVAVVLALTPRWFVFDRDLRNLRPRTSTHAYQTYVELGDRLGIDFAGLELFFRGEDAESLLDQVAAFHESLAPLQMDIPVVLAEDLSLALLRTGIASLNLTGLSDQDVTARHILLSPWGRIGIDRIAGNTLHGLSLLDEPEDPAATVLPAGSELALAAILRPASQDASLLHALPAPRQQRTIFAALEEVDWDGLRTVLANQEPEVRQRYAAFVADLEAMAERAEAKRMLMPGDLDGTPLRQLLDQILARGDDDAWYLRLPLPLAHDRSFVPFQELQTALGFDSGPEGDEDNRMLLADGVRVSVIGGTALEFYVQKLVIENFAKLTAIAAITTVLLLALAMRQIAAVLVTLGTLAAGILLMLAWMHVLGLQWTILNICVLPLIIGIGIDNGIHFLHHLARQDRSHNGLLRTMMEIGHPILMTALTSVAGFGSLLLNAYRGVQDLGLLASIGILSCLVATILVLPTILIFTHFKPPPDREQDPRSRVMPSITIPGGP